MSSRQFEKFLANCLIKWASEAIQPGFRYQFKSPDVDNSSFLFQAFLEHSGGKISFKSTENKTWTGLETDRRSGAGLIGRDFMRRAGVVLVEQIGRAHV